MQNPGVKAIVQARMTSTRLPGKVLMDISGRPMLWHVAERLKRAKQIDEIILAIPSTKENDLLENFAVENSIKYHRGSEEDVLSRYYETAEKFGLETIVRITADCPLIDPGIVDEIVVAHVSKSADYTSNIIKRTFPRGFDAEVMSFGALKEAFGKAKKKYQREHVTPYIYENPERFRLQNVEGRGTLRRPDLRLTVDTKEDFEVIRAIYEKLYKEGEIIEIREAIEFLERRPDIRNINRNVKQKAN